MFGLDNSMETCDRLYGENVHLRQVELTDVNATYVGWLNDSEVNQFLESRFEQNTLQTVRNFIEQVIESNDTVMFAIVLSKHDRHIGNIKIGPINRIHGFADVGLLIGDKDSWGRGFATEAISLITGFGFGTLGLNRITASCYGNNLGSTRAFQKVGYRIDGRRPNQFLCNGKYEDQIMLGLTAADWSD